MCKIEAVMIFFFCRCCGLTLERHLSLSHNAHKRITKMWTRAPRRTQTVTWIFSYGRLSCSNYMMCGNCQSLKRALQTHFKGSRARPRTQLTRSTEPRWAGGPRAPLPIVLIFTLISEYEVGGGWDWVGHLREAGFAKWGAQEPTPSARSAGKLRVNDGCLSYRRERSKHPAVGVEACGKSGGARVWNKVWMWLMHLGEDITTATGLRLSVLRWGCSFSLFFPRRNRLTRGRTLLAHTPHKSALFGPYISLATPRGQQAETDGQTHWSRGSFGLLWIYSPR